MQGRMRPLYVRQRIDVFIEGHKNIQLEDAPFRGALAMALPQLGVTDET
jgi:hypothetical protein